LRTTRAIDVGRQAASLAEDYKRCIDLEFIAVHPLGDRDSRIIIFKTEIIFASELRFLRFALRIISFFKMKVGEPP
jgi:hypothetical protein